MSTPWWCLDDGQPFVSTCLRRKKVGTVDLASFDRKLRSRDFVSGLTPGPDPPQLNTVFSKRLHERARCDRRRRRTRWSWISMKMEIRAASGALGTMALFVSRKDSPISRYRPRKTPSVESTIRSGGGPAPRDGRVGPSGRSQSTFGPKSSKSSDGIPRPQRPR